MTSLPTPSQDQSATSAQLTSVLAAEIDANAGWISFARYMELALYAPGLGYYSAGSKKIGAGGDFVTAPEISPLFARTLARQVAQVLRETGGDVLELGAGTGRLAAQLLLELQRLDVLPARYRILEVSAHLRVVQQETLAAALPAHLLQRVEWLDTLPEHMTGCMLGNEVLDALPVHLVARHADVGYERGVGWQAGQFVWRDIPLGPGPLQDAVARWSLPAGYLTECCLAAPALVASLAASLKQGALLLIDYGFPRHEYYHPQRTTGTLMCHYRQQAHDDPFVYPGLQDITAHVDFTAVAEGGVANGLDFHGYATQAQFLINCGITELLSEVSPADVANYLPLVTQAQKLLSPSEMGELFKVIALGRGIAPMQGFAQGDKRHTL